MSEPTWKQVRQYWRGYNAAVKAYATRDKKHLYKKHSEFLDGLRPKERKTYTGYASGFIDGWNDERNAVIREMREKDERNAVIREMREKDERDAVIGEM